LAQVRKYLGVERTNQIVSAIADVLIQAEVSGRVLNKIRKLMGCEQVQSMAELEKYLQRAEHELHQHNGAMPAE
jgi:hypothetical protein